MGNREAHTTLYFMWNDFAWELGQPHFNVIYLRDTSPNTEETA